MDFFEKPTIQSCAYSVLYSEKDCLFFCIYTLTRHLRYWADVVANHIFHICVTDKISLFSIMAHFPFSIITWN